VFTGSFCELAITFRGCEIQWCSSQLSSITMWAVRFMYAVHVLPSAVSTRPPLFLTENGLNSAVTSVSTCQCKADLLIRIRTHITRPAAHFDCKHSDRTTHRQCQGGKGLLIVGVSSCCLVLAPDAFRGKFLLLSCTHPANSKSMHDAHVFESINYRLRPQQFPMRGA
jgi:hypothetical protein